MERQVYFRGENKYIKLTSHDGLDFIQSSVDELCSAHEEPDNKLHTFHASREPSPNTIVVSSPNTDVSILLHHAGIISKALLFDTGSGNKRNECLICVHNWKIILYISPADV